MTDSAQLPAAQDRPPSLGELIERSADLKRGLVQYVQGPRFDRKLTAALLQAPGTDRSLEESTAISVIDQFALQHRLPDGRTPVERYADARKDLSPVEREMLLGWRDVVEGLFEIRARDGDEVSP
ncbi:hypothetical protein ACWEQN_48165 [Streptomyces sp. NPDC004129]